MHQARVATRRLPSDLRAFRAVLDSDSTKALRAELDWLGLGLGEVRDREVLSARLRGQSKDLSDPLGVELAFSVLAGEIRSLRDELSDLMRSARSFRLVDTLVQAAPSPRLGAELLRPRVDRAWKRLRRAVRATRADPASQMQHAVRIEAKRVRYQ